MKTIKGLECRFATHIPTKTHEAPDLHLVKEVVHYDDGTSEPRVRLIENFVRTFGVTRPAHQNHQQKKESELLDNLVIHRCTQSELRQAVAGALGNRMDPRPLNQLSASPYLYGSDISSTSIIKYQYMKKYPDFNTPYSVSHLDIETDVVNGTDDPIMVTLVFKDKVFFSVVRSFVPGYNDIENRYFQAVDKYIKEYVEKHQFKIEFHLAENPVDMLKETFARLHRWLPDFVAIWNIGFDVPRMMKTFEKYGVDPADVICDPSIPPERRFAKYREGSTKKITASGQVKPKKPSEQWHSLIAPCGFWFIDQMSAYRFVRQGGQELAEYSLDFVLETELGIRKLKFEEANGYHRLAWHQFMQKNYPFEYMVYNNFDSISCHELEVAKNDLSLSVPIRTNISDFSRFDSQTKRFSDKYHYFLLANKGEMIGTVPPKPKDEKSFGGDEEIDFIGEFEDDDEDEIEELDEVGELEEVMNDSSSTVLGLRNWIATLKSHLSSLGLNLVKEWEELQTMLRAFVYDIDAVSAYPNCAAVNNVSKATTLSELITIIGVDESIFRQQNINLLQGHVNAAEYCRKMFGLPGLKDCLSLFDDM